MQAAPYRQVSRSHPSQVNTLLIRKGLDRPGTGEEIVMLTDTANLLLSMGGLYYLLTRMDPFGVSFTEGGKKIRGEGVWVPRIPWTLVPLKQFKDL